MDQWIHPLLSCSRSPPWRFWWHSLKAASSSSLCRGSDLNATAIAFHYAMDFVRIFLPQVSYIFQHQAVFFVLCEKLDALSAGNWEQLGQQGVPIPHFAEEVKHLSSTSLGTQLPCLFGWVAALLCELRVQQALFIMKANRLKHGEAPIPKRQKKLERMLASEASQEDVMNDLYGTEPWPLPELKIPSLEGLADPKDISLVETSGHRALTLLDSSGWAKFSDLLEALPPGELGPALDASALVMALQFQAPAMAQGQVPLRYFKVWAVSAHPSLLLEPISQWRKIADITEVVMMTMLSTSHCTDAENVSLVCDDEMQDMFHQLGTREDGLGHFPVVENFHEFVGNFLHRAKDFLQSDLLLCGEPAFLCWLLYEYKPVVGYLGNPLGAYLTAKWQMLFYDFVAKTPQASLQLVFMSPPIAAQAYWQMGRRIPVMRPVADYLGVSYAPATLDVLITKQDPPFLEMKCCPLEVYTFWDFQCILNEGAQLLPGTQATPAETRPVRFRYMSHLEDRSWKAWSSFRAAVVLPYDAQTLVFYELYSLGMPLLVPEETLLPLFFMRSYGYDGSVQHQRPGWQLTRSGAAWGPWHQAWSSLAELFGFLLPSRAEKLSSTSAAMRQALEMRAWQMVLTKEMWIDFGMVPLCHSCVFR
ncbi:unnamed protein product [Cladocopium goreaui]|uniref:Uncharacterized protein n=1 Tax=Cladocopium goreaui TaxID=2562237 RepID=A0A9P1M455_9DINO|nr:unnamed protein product [Cladocopium goreaui]